MLHFIDSVLHVEPLLAEDIEIHHNRSGSGSCNIILGCTVNEEDVTITWSHTDRTDTEGPGPTLHIYNESDGAYTCTARNPVSSASRGLELSDICNKGTDQTQLGGYIYYLMGLITSPLILGFIWCFVRKRRKRPDYENQNVVEEMGAQSVRPQETENQRKKPRTQNERNKQQTNPEPLYQQLTSSFIEYDVIGRQL
eukprot:XP_017952442.1 PREDICTED: signaling lymphocytic activation molecule-like [Xenopus tropicalis]